MSCLICKDLTRVLESAIADYRTARSASFYLVCTEVAARIQVDMERAKTALSEHQSCCEAAERLAVKTWNAGTEAEYRHSEYVKSPLLESRQR